LSVFDHYQIENGNIVNSFLLWYIVSFSKMKSNNVYE